MIKDTPINEIHPAPWNPRSISDIRFKQLCESIKDDPEFMRSQPILATKDGTIYSGNMRYRACVSLGWETVPVIFDDIDELQAKKRALQANNTFGEWNDDDLDAIIQELNESGFESALLGFDEAISSAIESLIREGEKQKMYTDKIDIPKYVPSETKPKISEMIDQEKTISLIKRIKDSKIPEEEKVFLEMAAYRHLVFSYDKIADYYAHSNKAVQELMEQSALVIIDVDSAIQGGYVELIESIIDIYQDQKDE